ncbi:response regulator transcription factor [bacterium]|nr:response regulator transcription factor [bacterium]
MNVIIVEDEPGATRNMLALLGEIDPSIMVLATLERVVDAVAWIESHPPPDLGFFDIRLADGTSFEIFRKCTVAFPVVFTTAYNEYALQAFKVNSIDYLLKPIKQQELAFAIEKYRKLAGHGLFPSDASFAAVLQHIGATLGSSYKRTFLIEKSDGFVPVPAGDFAYFYIRNGLVRGVTRRTISHAIHEKLDSLEERLSPDDFFRANRQYIVARPAVTAVNTYFSGRLIIKTEPAAPGQIIVSRARAGLFKRWLER